MVNQDTTHQFRGESKELGSILPPNPMLFHEAQKSFVYERRWNKRVTGPLPAKVLICKTPKLVIDELNYPFVAFALGLKQLVQEDGYVAAHSHPRESRILSLAPWWCNAFRYARVASDGREARSKGASRS